jgi:hypothetical protein
MRITGHRNRVMRSYRMGMLEIEDLIEFLCGPTLDKWIDLFGLHIRASTIRAHLRIVDPAGDLADLAAYRESEARLGPTRAAATRAASPAGFKTHRRCRIPAYLYRGGRA